MRAALPSSAPSCPEPGPAARGGSAGGRGGETLAGTAGTALQDAQPEGRRDLVLAMAVALLPLALYARSLGWPALELSDAELRAADSVGEAARAAGLGGVSLYLDLGSSALVARAVALVLFSGTSALAFALLRALGLGRGACLWGALVFAAHPLQVESVAWLSQRGTLLGGFFFLLAARLTLGRGARSPRAGALALLPALLAEPRLLAGVPWLWLAERWVLGRRPARARVVFELALVALAGGSLLAGRLGALEPSAGLERLIELPRALATLAACAFVPTGLTPRHGLPGGAPAGLALAWLVLGLLLWALWRDAARRPRIGLGVLLFLLLASAHALLPRSADLVRESDGHLALLGLALALAAAAPRLAHSRPALVVLGGALVALAAVRSELRLGAWRSEPELQASALAVRPDDAHALLALGRWHLAHGRVSTAQAAVERARSLRPHDPSVLALAGELELRRAGVPGQEARVSAARALFERGQAFERLAELDQLMGDATAARAHLAAALEQTPGRADLHVRRGRAGLELGLPAEARTAFARALELDPRSAEAWSALGRLHFAQDEPEAAAQAFARALELEPDLVEANALLGRIQETRGERAAAEQHYRRALSIAPDRPDALQVDTLYALGALLADAGRADEALRFFERVVELRPDPPHVRAHLESARLHLARGATGLARARLEAVLRFNPAQPEARALLESLAPAGAGR